MPKGDTLIDAFQCLDCEICGGFCVVCLCSFCSQRMDNKAKERHDKLLKMGYLIHPVFMS